MKIIINADDYGLNSNVNKAIYLCFKKELISSTTMLANMPAFEEALSMSREINITNSIGLHFNLVEGLPLTKRIKECSRICNSEGEFIYSRRKLRFWTKEERYCIKEELLAQINMLKKNGIPITHFDSHRHIHTDFHLFILIFRILKKNRIEKIRITRNNKMNNSFIKALYKIIFNKMINLIGFKTTKKFASLFDLVFEKAESIELMCHPEKIKGEEILDSSGKNIIRIKDKLISYKYL